MDYDAKLRWRSQSRADELRKAYKAKRQDAYDSLDAFFYEVSNQLVKPAWAIPQSEADGGQKVIDEVNRRIGNAREAKAEKARQPVTEDEAT
jgi:hypothetical protein